MSDFNNIVPYSLGRVAVNKDLNSDIVYVWPQMILPMVDGEILDVSEEYVVEVADSFGRRSKITTNTAITLKCKYKSSDPNLMTVPDVRRGAIVQIYKLSNTDYYYWDTVTSTDNYQKLETRVMGYSNTQNEDEKPSEENTWTQGVSTHTKVVNLFHTTKSDGERWAYDSNLNAKDGVFVIMDDIGNMIKLDSPNNTIRLQNGAGTFLELNQTKIEWGCETYVGNAKSSMTETTKNKTGNYSSGWNTTSPTHGHTGNYNIAGGINSSPGAGGSGMTMNGDIKQTGGIISSGDHVIGGKSFLGHKHRETDSVTSTPI